MQRLRCLPALVQADRRGTKGYPGFPVKNGLLMVKGLDLEAASPSSYLFLL